MGLTRADLLETKWTEQDKREIAVVLKRYQDNDTWALKAQAKVGILLTSHPGNRGYLKACVETHKKLGYWITVAYDNYLHPDTKDMNYNNYLPAKDVMDNIDTFIMPHYQTWGGVLYPYFWLLRFGVNVMQDFEYVYCANGDMIIEKPEGFSELLKRFEGYDIWGTGPDIFTDNRQLFNTAGFICKTTVLKQIIQHFEKYLIPFETYEKYTQELGNTEGRFGRAIKDLGFKYKLSVPFPTSEQLFFGGQSGEWGELLGFRHLHAEMNYAYRHKGIPPPSKYLDERYTSGNDIKYIKLYEEKNDVAVLKDWYAK